MHMKNSRENTSHEVLQQCQLLSWFVFISRCCFFNLGRDWYVIHRGADLPRDAINLFPSTDMSGLIQYRHTNNNALFNAFFSFSSFYWLGLLKKIHLSHFTFSGEKVLGTRITDIHVPRPCSVLTVLTDEKSAILFAMAATMIDLFFFQKLCLY